MQSRVLQLDPRDDVIIALADLKKGETLQVNGQMHVLATDVSAKHKFAAKDFALGDPVHMYGVMVGRAFAPIRRGEAITVHNLRHDAEAYHEYTGPIRWQAPDVSRWKDKTFLGYRRRDGQVGTRNYWLVAPLVFCENRNLGVLKEAFEEELGFAQLQVYRRYVADLVKLYREGRSGEIQQQAFSESRSQGSGQKVFANVDGIKFLLHQLGCGGTREDAQNLCGLIADYIHHPNVAGATILSLGCQNAQVSILREEIARRAPESEKPIFIFEQQSSPSEAAMLGKAIQKTFLGMIEADKLRRTPASISDLVVALKCGGSDGFSGLSANPAVGHVSDLLAALKGRTILAEFPELCGVEQELINRSVRKEVADRFVQLMNDYAARAKAVRAGFDMNPSPGNISDGLITDAMKSAGAAKKGGTSPVSAVLDYPEYSSEPGLNLLCTPGGDVECVTAQVGAGSNIVLFTTGLGTPTGNPIAPVIKISSNTPLAIRMADIIDFDAGSIISGESTIEQTGEALLAYILKVASGDARTSAELHGQDDFIPWKRGVSL
ncbi:MAG: UxaA family hydrolase [Candidatus Acidiferrales bacterium]